jgi:hypothetical protein
MTVGRGAARAAAWLGAAAGVAAVGYGGLVTIAWLRYGHAAPPSADDADALLDRFMPAYDIVERHRVPVAAPAATTFASAAEVDINAPLAIRAIFKGRELFMGASPNTTPQPRAFLALAKSIGWGVLAEHPGREIVLGAVTQPWLADVVFRPLPPDEFPAFNEPGFVKIAWTLRADAVGASRSVFRTETRVIATDPASRAKFRRYWSRVSPGVVLIRWLMLGPVKAAAERRARSLPS